MTDPRPFHQLLARTDGGPIAGQPGLVIADQGVGMSPEQVGRIFDRFYRADTSGSIAGTGLGMSIVKEIMAVHGGTVDVASRPGQGTRVCLWLRA